MSEYIDFFIRADKDKYLPLCSHCRSTKIYEYFQNIVPYERVAAISQNMLDAVIKIADEQLKNIHKIIEDINKTTSLIPSFTNSMDDKLEALENYNQTLSEYNEDIKQIEWTKEFCYFLSDILDEGKYYSPDPNNIYLVAGIEISEPTDADLIN